MTRRIEIRKDQFIAYDEFINDSEWIVAIDCGHGGVIDGEHQTPEKTFKHDWGTFDEGTFNRAIGLCLSGLLLREDVSHYFTTDSKYDISLPVRTIRANNFQRKYPNKKHLFLSLHGNAFKDSRANGVEVWTSPGETKSDKYATILYNSLKDVEWKMRSDFTDGDPDKESRFYVLVNTNMPAVLLELGFYSNSEEAKKMEDPEVQRELSELILKGILEIINSEK